MDTMPPDERVTVTLSADLVRYIDRLEPNRSRFIAEAVEHEIRRRSRDALLHSLGNPHPESKLLANADLRDWASGLPIETESLVDVTAGTAVRWAEGQGWVEVEE